MPSAMRPIRRTISMDEARAIVLQAAVPIERAETLPIAAALNRVLAGAVTAGTDVPPFDRAAMDGYAVIAADTFGATRHEPRTLSCIEKVFTGQTATRSVTSGE